MDLEHAWTAQEGRGARHRPRREPGQEHGLSSPQAYHAAYRFVAKYYDYERIAPILRLLETFSATGHDLDTEAYVMWQACVQDTLDGVPLPTLPPPWDS